MKNIEFSFTHIRNPRWLNAEHTVLDCEVNFDHLDDEYVFYGCYSNMPDHEITGKKIFSEVTSGMWGPIEEYIAPDDWRQFETEEQRVARLREKRNQLLAKTDWTQGGDLPQALKEPWAVYRQALRDLPQHPDWPDFQLVPWPEEPV